MFFHLHQPFPMILLFYPHNLSSTSVFLESSLTNEVLLMMTFIPLRQHDAISLAVGIATVLISRMYYVLKSIRNPERRSQRRKLGGSVSTLVVLGSGGHTTEMMRLLASIDANRYAPLVYVIATTDTTSLDQIEAAADSSESLARRGEAVFRIPRSREVGQSYVTSIVSTLRACFSAIYLACRVRPNLVLCNGPGTCVPIVVSIFFLRFLGLIKGNVVFVESFCRVQR